MTCVSEPLTGVWHWPLGGGTWNVWGSDVWGGIGSSGLSSPWPVDCGDGRSGPPTGPASSMLGGSHSLRFYGVCWLGSLQRC